MPRKKQEVKEKETSILKLPYKQELFCRYYIETAGNKTKSALLSFDVHDRELALRWMGKDNLTDEEVKIAKSAYFTASVVGHEYFEKPKVKQRIEELIKNEYFTDATVQREHVKILLQDNDLSTKKGGIEMYYKLRGKFMPEKTEVSHTINIPNIQNKSLEELQKIESEVMKSIC